MLKVAGQDHDLKAQYLAENCIFGTALSRSRSYGVNIQAKSWESVVWNKMTPPEIHVPQEAVVNFHDEIVKVYQE